MLATAMAEVSMDGSKHTGDCHVDSPRDIPGGLATRIPPSVPYQRIRSIVLRLHSLMAGRMGFRLSVVDHCISEAVGVMQYSR